MMEQLTEKACWMVYILKTERMRRTIGCFLKDLNPNTTVYDFHWTEKVLSSGGVITDGPFVEIKKKLGSFIVVEAANIDDAVTLAHGCPVIDEGGSVEIRPVFNQLKN